MLVIKKKFPNFCLILKGWFLTHCLALGAEVPGRGGHPRQRPGLCRHEGGRVSPAG